MTYNNNSHQGVVIGGDYDAGFQLLTVYDDAGHTGPPVEPGSTGYNPTGQVELGTKRVIGWVNGPLSAGTNINLSYHG